MLGGLLGRPTETRAQATDWGVWPGDVPSGVHVTPESSLQLLTVYGCVSFICDQISTLPVDTYRKLPDGSREEVPSPLWVKEPTVDLEFTDWCGQVLTSLLLHGNCYLAVLRNESNSIVEVVPLDPCKVHVERVNGRKVYRVNGFLYGGEIVHIKGAMLPGSDVGYAPIEAARLSVGLGIAAARYGAESFQQDLNMPGVIELTKPAQPGQMREIAENWRRKRNKGGRGLPGILDDGATWKATAVTNEQAQFLETRKYTAAEIAGQLFKVDPTDLGIPVDGTSITYANLEQRNIRRVQVTLLPWLIRIERAVSALLANPRYMKFNVDGLLRADLKTRYESYAIGLAGAPFLTVDEPRGWEDLEGPAPVPAPVPVVEPDPAVPAA
jgi:HK97 family phage portal protein